MTRAIEISAMILGSASLLAVSFLGFAMMSGVPLHEVAVVGGLFEPPPTPEVDAPDGQANPPSDPLEGLPQGKRPARTPDRVVQSSLGLMSAYSLPSPYTQAELHALADELKGRSARLDARKLELDEREEAIEALEQGYEQRLEALQDLQDRLDTFQRELLQREREVEREEETARLADERKYAEIARLLAGFDAERRTQLLVQYAPDEAALILVALDEDVRTEAMSALGDTLPPEKVKEYVEAYSQTADSTR